MVLGRGSEKPDRVERNIIEPFREEEKTGPDASGARPGLEDPSWKVVFLVPISELTGRRTVTMHRMVPYEVRNDLWLLDSPQKSLFEKRVMEDFTRLRENKWLKTTGYVIETQGKKAGR